MDEEVGGHHDVMLPPHHDAHTGHDHHEEVGHHHDVCHLVLVDEAAVILIVEPERPLQLLLRGLRREKLESLQERLKSKRENRKIPLISCLVELLEVQVAIVVSVQATEQFD